ncbi:hypothetical protein T484DRAFT_1846779 [Baffinella frigidus]|nr:hypothetical protein T484DRAFT_1846779 [Cryptophyta sp. CCMP2293]
MACTDFPIRAGETVTYGLSRSAKGEVTMTLNGIECAKQKPPYLGRFQLDPQDISFFKDDGGENSAGTITSIAAFAAVLSEPDIQSKAGCVESFTVSHTKCSSRVYQVPYPDMTFSCSWANDAAG